MSNSVARAGPHTAKKEEARAYALGCRRRLAVGATIELLEMLSTHVFSILKARPGRETVAAYWPLASEIDTRLLVTDLLREGYPLVLPRVVGPHKPLEFGLWQAGDPLFPSAFKVLEPSPEAPSARPDVVLVPLVSFDRAGYRLGYGAGFYDRTLAALRKEGEVLAVGLAYAGQRVEELPTEAHDEPLDLIATEDGIFRPGEDL